MREEERKRVNDLSAAAAQKQQAKLARQKAYASASTTNKVATAQATVLPAHVTPAAPKLSSKEAKAVKKKLNKERKKAELPLHASVITAASIPSLKAATDAASSTTSALLSSFAPTHTTAPSSSLTSTLAPLIPQVVSQTAPPFTAGAGSKFSASLTSLATAAAASVPTAVVERPSLGKSEIVEVTALSSTALTLPTQKGPASEALQHSAAPGGSAPVAAATAQGFVPAPAPENSTSSAAPNAPAPKTLMAGNLTSGDLENLHALVECLLYIANMLNRH